MLFSCQIGRRGEEIGNLGYEEFGFSWASDVLFSCQIGRRGEEIGNLGYEEFGFSWVSGVLFSCQLKQFELGGYGRV